MIRLYKDLQVWERSYKLAMEIFYMCKDFPKEELYSLTSQMIRSSRSISANVTEGWAKREYESVFKRHLIDASGSCSETENWLLFAKDCGYIKNEVYEKLKIELSEIGKMLIKLHQNWKS